MEVYHFQVFSNEQRLGQAGDERYIITALRRAYVVGDSKDDGLPDVFWAEYRGVYRLCTNPSSLR